MRIILTTHAKQRMFERNITLDNIKSAIEIPDFTISSGKKIETQKKILEKTLKVIYLKEDNYIKVITVVWK